MKVELHLCVRGSNLPVFLVRTLDLPFAPWVGMEITHLMNESSDLYEHTIEHVSWNAIEQCFFVRLTSDTDNDSERTSQEIVDADYPPEWRQET